MTLDEAIRQAIADRQAAGETIYAICQAIGVRQPVVARYVNEGTTLTLPTAQKLMDHLGITVAYESPKRGKRKRPES